MSHFNKLDITLMDEEGQEVAFEVTPRDINGGSRDISSCWSIQFNAI
jgi:hypothetical protein